MSCQPVAFRIPPDKVPALSLSKGGLSSATEDGKIIWVSVLTAGTIDDSDADGDSVIHAEVTSGSGYTIDTNPHNRVVYVGVEDDD